MEHRRVVVIGGGIVGLSTGMAMLSRFPALQLTVLEKESALARHQTGHNSGVIHSGIYYRPGSLKARFTVAGARELVELARARGIAHEICGKVVVATDAAELPRLEELHRRAVANQVPGAEMIGVEELREIEPHAAGVRALKVSSTGIIDYVGVANAYADEIRARGGEIRTSSRVEAIERDGGAFVVTTNAGEVRADHLVNCAGLYSDVMARLAGCDPQVRIVPFRGEYHKLVPQRQHLVRALIYPVPDPAFPFLGVHFTRMIGGGVEAGPNAVLSLKREGYRKTDFDLGEALQTLGYAGFRKLALRYWRTGAAEIFRSLSKRAFVRALQRLLPEIREADLEAGGAGVRAQAIAPDGALLDDFAIEALGGAIHVLNAPSPAATASLPIGRAVADRAAEYFDWKRKIRSEE